MTNIGSPWVYLFSRFTSEALLFEALIIFSLCAVYTAFWLLKKRKFGVVQHEVPAGVVKYYLNELIVDAEQLRAQLFGLLSGQGIAATPIANLSLGTGIATAASAGIGALAATATGGDPQAMAALEAKLATQAKQIEAFVSEKTKIEQELTVARAAHGGAATGGDPGAIAKLQEKISQLEGKLSEYSVIEDDLANLKRLQQENAALKAQLAGKGTTPGVTAEAAPETGATTDAVTGISAAAATTAATGATAAPSATANTTTTNSSVTATATAAATPAAPTAQATPAPITATVTPMDAATAAGNPTVAPTPAPTPGAPGLGASIAQAEAGALGESGFEGLVDQVEQSLQPQAGAQAPAAGAPASTSTTANPTATIEKSDADLVAEFEKMLNG